MLLDILYLDDDFDAVEVVYVDLIYLNLNLILVH